MNVVSIDDADQQNALTNSDLKGLLKAASLTEFHPDVVPEGNSREFEKSNSLFDLVKSNLLDTEPSTIVAQSEISNSGNYKELKDVETQQSNLSEKENGSAVEDTATPQAVNSSDKIHGSDVSNLQLSWGSQDADSVKVDDIKIESEHEVKVTDQNIDSEEVTQKKEIKDAGGGLDKATGIEESDEFLSELKQVQITFDKKLDNEKKEFATLIEAMFGASNFIAAQMENQISDVVLEIASDLAGTKIDEVPEAFAKKISLVAKQIIGNNDEVTVHLNAADYAKLKTSKNFSELKYIFLENQILRRGEFEVIGRKSSAGVSLFEFSDAE